MPYLAGGVIVAIGLTVLNLLLTLGVIRRLREHTDLLSKRPPGGVPGGGASMMVGVGEAPGEFTAVTTGGRRITRGALAAGHLVGFFSPGCEPCHEKAPLFAELAAGRDRDRVLAVVVSSAGEAGEAGGAVDEFRAMFEPVAHVVVEPVMEPGSVAEAFRVKGYPGFCTLDGAGLVTATGFEAVRTAAGPARPVPVP